MGWNAGRTRGSLWYAALVALVVALGAGLWRLSAALRAGPVAGERESAPMSAESARRLDEALDAARSYLRDNKPGSAEAILREAAAKYPGDQRIELLCAEAALSQGEFGRAFGHYDRAIAIGPDHAEYRHAAGTVGVQAGKLAEAREHYAAAKALDPANPKYPLYLAQVERSLGDLAGARSNLDLAVRLDPALAIGWAGLASLELDAGNAPLAIEHAERARRLEPERTAWRILEARALRRGGRAEQGADLLFALPEPRRMSDPSVMAELGLCLGEMGRASEAAEMLAKAAALRPGDKELAAEAERWRIKSGE